MNTPRSTALGWGALIVAAGFSFVYAKKGINERRRQQSLTGERPSEMKDWKQRIGEPLGPPPNEDGTHRYTKSVTPEDGLTTGLKKGG